MTVIDRVYFSFVCLLKLILYSSRPKNQKCDRNIKCFCFAKILNQAFLQHDSHIWLGGFFTFLVDLAHGAPPPGGLVKPPYTIHRLLRDILNEFEHIHGKKRKEDLFFNKFFKAVVRRHTGGGGGSSSLAWRYGGRRGAVAATLLQQLLSEHRCFENGLANSRPAQ